MFGPELFKATQQTGKYVHYDSLCQHSSHGLNSTGSTESTDVLLHHKDITMLLSNNEERKLGNSVLEESGCVFAAFWITDDGTCQKHLRTSQRDKGIFGFEGQAKHRRAWGTSALYTAEALVPSFQKERERERNLSALIYMAIPHFAPLTGPN